MLTPLQMVNRINSAFGSAIITASNLDGTHPWAAASAESWPQVARFLRDDPELQFLSLRCITGLDYPDKKQFCVAYDLMSMERGHEFCIKVFVPREKPEIPSVAEVWHAADWHEREAYDMFGIVFTGHPDSVTDAGGTHPRRILLPEDWEGFPLRKDYVFPREYHGIPGSVETDWAQKPEYPK